MSKMIYFMMTALMANTLLTGTKIGESDII